MARNKGIAALTRSRLSSEYDFKALLEKQITVQDVNNEEPLTVREYFLVLLTTLWEEQEGFSGKRPFGNSCWDLSLLQALIEGGVMPGKLEYDSEGYLEECDPAVDAHEFVRLLIANL